MRRAPLSCGNGQMQVLWVVWVLQTHGGAAREDAACGKLRGACHIPEKEGDDVLPLIDQAEPAAHTDTLSRLLPPTPPQRLQNEPAADKGGPRQEAAAAQSRAPTCASQRRWPCSRLRWQPTCT